jgi:predicted GH43/DUF377 family glycosyl hydrolase
VFARCEQNPLLTAADWPYPVNTVFNPGATRLADDSTLLLCRVEDHRGISHLCAARSPNGVDDWTVDTAPTFPPDPRNWPGEVYGVEDPRITWIPETEQYALTYTAVSRGGPAIALAFTRDFKNFERLGTILPPEDKDAALLPHRVGACWAMVHRPTTALGANMWISYSPDLRHWGSHKIMLLARSGPWWDAVKVGLTCPPVETPEGWLVIYHGVRTHAAGAIYRLGLALFDLETPETCLLRGEEWVFGPEAPYERQGDVPDVVFPCGYTVEPDGRTLNLYYGAADSCVALARADIRELLDWLRNCGSRPDAAPAL